MMQAPIEIELQLCYPSPRAREVDRNSVEALAASIKEIGLLSAITVRKVQKSRNGIFCDAFEVIAGMHRVKAFRWLQKTRIPAVVIEADDLRAELMLIDENLRRNDLTPAERSAAQARRKRVWQELHPETKRGATGVSRSKEKVGKLCQPISDGGEDALAPAERYDEASSKATGDSARKVRLDVQRGEALGDDALAKVARTSLDKGDELDALAKLKKAAPQKCDELIGRAAAGEKVSAKLAVKQARRDDRERERATKLKSLPEKAFGVVVEDFEWDDEVWSRDTGMDRHAANHYETAADAHTPEEIVERTRERWSSAADDCVALMWTTNQHLAVAIDVLRLRGFKYVSNYCWGKDKISTGRWNRSKHELLLVGTRGNVECPAPGTQWDSLIVAPKGAHSAKPECFLEMVESYWPNVPKIELNRRGPPRQGWFAWGNEVEEPIGEPVVQMPLICNGEGDPASDPGFSAGSPMGADQWATLDIPKYLKRSPDASECFDPSPEHASVTPAVESRESESPADLSSVAE